MTRKTIICCDQCGTDFEPSQGPQTEPENRIYSFHVFLENKQLLSDNITKDFCSPDCLRKYVAQIFGIKEAPLMVTVDQKELPTMEEIRTKLLTVWQDNRHSYVRDLLARMGVPDAVLNEEEGPMMGDMTSEESASK